jgi:hypothetical protein
MKPPKEPIHQPKWMNPPCSDEEMELHWDPQPGPIEPPDHPSFGRVPLIPLHQPPQRLMGWEMMDCPEDRDTKNEPKIKESK